MQSEQERRIALPERTARLLADLLMAALAGQAVAQSAANGARGLAERYQMALALVADDNGVGSDVRFDRETGELVVQEGESS